MGMVLNISRNGKYHIPDGLRQLFDAMLAGKIIKKVIYSCDTSDISIENFIALEYTVGLTMDFVDTNKLLYNIPRRFYMHWVKSFELYPCVQLEDGSEVELRDLNQLFAE